MYFLGKKVSYGFDEANNYLLMAAKQNHAEALYFLTVLYYNDKHSPKYVNKAIHYATLAAKQNDKLAQF